MVVHRGPEQLAGNPRPDILIVGAGAVGIAMAVHLARRGRQVTMIEGGPDQPPADFCTRNAGPTRGRPFEGLENGRMKALGGTTRLWGGQLVPFDEGDFAVRDDQGRLRWPIDFAEYERWLAQAYDLLGVDPDSRATQQLWRNATGADPDFGEGLSAHMNVWLDQPDFVQMFGDELRGSPNISCHTGSELVRLAFAGDGKVSSVEIAHGDGRRVVLEPREVILACGTIEISRLLLRAARMELACPFATNPHLGRWFMDHLHGLVGTLADIDEAKLRTLFDNVYFRGRKYNVKLRVAGQARPGTNIAITLNPRMTLRELAGESLGLVKRMARGSGGIVAGLRQCVTMARLLVPLGWRYLVRRRSMSMFASGTAIGVEVEQLPNPESYVFLDPDADPVHARAGVSWAIDGREAAALASVCARLRASFAHLGFGQVVLDPRAEQGDPAIFDTFHPSSHHMGGARMAHGPDDGVVDADSRVFGSANLSIAGAAIFPSGSFANCTLTAIALGLRTAHRVAGQCGQGGNGKVMDRIVFGCARLTGGASTRESLGLLETAFAAGVRAVDVAPLYGLGLAEKVVGEAVARASRRGIEVEVIAKLGSQRPSHPVVKSWLRAAKRAVRRAGPRPMGEWFPRDPQARFGTGDFAPDALRASFDIAIRRLGKIDRLYLHTCGPDELGPPQQAVHAELAGRCGAAQGYAVDSRWDERFHRLYPDGYHAECAIAPGLLAGTCPPPTSPGTIFHSIIPAMHFLLRTEPAFAAALDKAAGLLPEADPQTARIAATYVLAAFRAPDARFVYASNDRVRLEGFLKAIAMIDRAGMGSAIVECFAV